MEIAGAFNTCTRRKAKLHGWTGKVKGLALTCYEARVCVGMLEWAGAEQNTATNNSFNLFSTENKWKRNWIAADGTKR